nr:translation initiation factor IF-2 [Pseudoxanthomonas sp.]
QQGEKVARPPVVTIMGHVDHGKTSLLDYIRRTKIASGEAGGITQHIGAYHVETPKGVISFLDTPGHAAFTAMRARGAKLTDIVVLVVAADDGVMPQTREAIQHAKAAKVPLIVAVNKIDKSDADPLRVKNELLAEEVVAEDFGGDTQMVEISAKTGQGVDNLLDAISIQAELLELRAVEEGRASGVVIESSLDKGRGPVATVLVQQGTLKKGDYLVCGIQYGRVRALFDETGGQPPSAGPSIPVQVLGLSGVPEAGDDFVVVEDERLAKDVAQQRDAKRRESRLVQSAGSRMEDIMAQLGKGEGQLSLNLIIKADVQGSVEALRHSLTALSNESIRINIISSGVGGITESDANSAVTSKATVIGFNVRADASARRIIEANGVDLRYFSIIYDVIDQVKQVASGLLGVEIREEIIGIAEVRDVFRSSKFGAVAGCMVVEGTVKRNKPIRVLRASTVVFEGELESLRRFKENVDEVRNGTECGIGVKAYNDVQPGDQIECFERIEVQRTL